MGLFSSIGNVLGSVTGSVIPGIIGGIGDVISGSRAADNAARDNYAAQKEFAQNGIRWRVDDAKAAGIHPLYAMGAQPMSFSPSYVSGDSLANGFMQSGSELGRAIDAGRTAPERTQARLEALSVERAELENDLLRSQIAKINQPGHPPSLPSVGDVSSVPSEYVSSRLGVPSLEAAPPNPANKEFINADGTISLWPSNEAKQAIEDSPYEWEHIYRNRFIPAASDWLYDTASSISNGFWYLYNYKR